MQEQPVTTTAVCEADRPGRAAGQLVTTTALCEAGRCRACPGRIVSAHPRPRPALRLRLPRPGEGGLMATDRRRRLVEDVDRTRGLMGATITDARRAGAEVPDPVTASITAWRDWAAQLLDWADRDT